MFNTFIIGMWIVFGALIILAIIGWIVDGKVVYKPEQREQVEVVEKRIISESAGEDYTYHYIVAFKFPDNSVKEIEVGRGGNFALNNPTGVYDSVGKGDTGILTYKEIENIEEKYKKEDRRYKGRLFISFWKDP